MDVTDERAKEQWRRLIRSALPKRKLPVHRDALISMIISELTKWLEHEPEMPLYAKRLKKLTSAADRLSAVIEKAKTSLRELGADTDLQEAYIWTTALTKPVFKEGRKSQTLQQSIDNVRADVEAGKPWQPAPLSGYSAALDLYLIPLRASEELQKWDRIYRRPRHRPRDNKVDLIRHLRNLMCEWPIEGERAEVRILSQPEFDDLLAALSGAAGLPKLDAEALKKRKQRSKGASRARGKGTN